MAAFTGFLDLSQARLVAQGAYGLVYEVGVFYLILV